MSEKRSSLSRKSILRLVVLGVILFLGTGFAAGSQAYRQNLSIYERAAHSYANMLCYQVGQVDLEGIVEHRDEITELEKKREEILNRDSYDPNDVSKLLGETDQNIVRLYRQWDSVFSFVIGFGNICSDIRYAYVVIPSEDDLIYVWDSDVVEGEWPDPFERDPYSGKEKDYLIAIMNGEITEDFFTDSIDGELIGTALCAIKGMNGDTEAVAAIDISISSIRGAFLKLLLNIGLAILMIMLTSIMVYHSVIRMQIIDPIVTLTEAADDLVNDLQEDNGEPFRVDVHTGDEIDVLARSFEEMDARLIDYIRENAAITAEKERIGTELSLARRIQADMLPSVFPPFPDKKEIDLYATMSPAKEVGGDFYDFFMVNEDLLALVMADVSGKGIPAALFMMMSKIMIQNFALTITSPAEVLEKVNEQICMNSIEDMFVTVWLGMLDLKTGLMTAANAGHEYPILKTPQGEFELIKDKHGLVIGGIEGYHFKEYTLQLEQGSRLFLYTDGLPEATDPDEKMFGIERTLNALNEIKDGTPKEVLEHVAQSVAAFVGSAPQFDDTTMLCLDYYRLKTDEPGEVEPSPDRECPI